MMPTQSTPRMQQLQQMLQKEPNDTFLLYGLALEFKKANDAAQALQYLDRVISLDSGYCYAYHQKGLIHESADNLQAAKAAYRAGVEAATKKGDNHARQEIEAALMMIE
jgi:Tfp pilus assembly protein PilF